MKIIRISLFSAILGLLISGLISNTAIALDVPIKPTDIPIVDQTNTLTEDQKATLAGLIDDESQESGNQIAIVMISSLEGEAIEEYSIRIAREWGIGSNENNNGVLLLIVKDDKKIRIEVGYGLEGALTDITSGKIIKNEISPAFKNGQYYEGIKAGLNSIIMAIHGEYTGRSSNSWSETIFNYIPDILFLLIIIVFSWLGSILGRTKSWWLGGVIGFVIGLIILVVSGFGISGIISIFVLTPIGLLFDKIVSKNYKKRTKSGDKPSWWAGGGFFGGGSSGGSDGGFGGFGGGDFGGGGASGDW